jgi:hypothetical protein
VTDYLELYKVNMNWMSIYCCIIKLPYLGIIQFNIFRTGSSKSAAPPSTVPNIGFILPYSSVVSHNSSFLVGPFWTNGVIGALNVAGTLLEGIFVLRG